MGKKPSPLNQVEGERRIRGREREGERRREKVRGQPGSEASDCNNNNFFTRPVSKQGRCFFFLSSLPSHSLSFHYSFPFPFELQPLFPLLSRLTFKIFLWYSLIGIRLAQGELELLFYSFFTYSLTHCRTPHHNSPLSSLPLSFSPSLLLSFSPFSSLLFQFSSSLHV